MPHLPDVADPAAWSRYFAMETNNRAWQLAAQPARTTAESREMLHAAHASAWHWNSVGTDLNRARATYLVAEVHALLGLGDTALEFAVEALAFFEGLETPDWELAYLHTIHAHAAAAAGDGQAHADTYAAAEAALRAIADPEDRRIVEQTFAQVPRPAIEDVAASDGFPAASSLDIAIRTARDMPDALAACMAHGGLLLTESDLSAEFFDLRTGLAGEALQKFVNYRARVAIVVEQPENHGERFHELVREHRTHPMVRFFPTVETAERWLNSKES